MNIEAENLTGLLWETWASEESMAEFVKTHMKLSKFDRTADAHKLVHKFLEVVLSTPGFKPTRHDKWEWVCRSVRDWSLASQLLLNLQEGTPGIQEDVIASKTAAFQKEFENVEDSPFAKKAKFKTEGDCERYNLALAHAKNAKILGEINTGLTSFRVSPLGQTPALADSNNLSQLSIAGLTDLLYASTFLLNREAIMKHINLRPTEEGAWMADGLSVPIYSKSGGDIVVSALVSRWVADFLLRDWSIGYVVPKYDTVLVVGSSESVKTLLNQGLISEYSG